MEESERKDVEWALLHGCTDLKLAHAARLKAEETAILAAQETRRLTIEKGRWEKDARLKAILFRHQDRFVVSINGKRVPASKKEISFPCQKCGAELPQILESLGEAMEGTFEKLWTEDFSNGSGHARIVLSDVTCSKCKEHNHYRCIPLPF